MELTIEVKPKPGKHQELYQTFQAVLPTFRKAEGCLDFRIDQVSEGGETFFLLVQWEEQADFEDYMRSNSGSALLGAMDLLCETVRFRLAQNAPWEGLETLKRVRKPERLSEDGIL